jgi:hypothetical protein
MNNSPTTAIRPIPTICILVTISILCIFCVSSADEAKQENKQTFRLSDLFVGLSLGGAGGGGGANDVPISYNDGSVALASEAVEKLLHQLNKENGQTEAHRGSKRHQKIGRRQVLYDLSLRNHYENLLKQYHPTSTSSSIQQHDINSSSDHNREQCAYYNEGINSIDIRKAFADADRSIFSKFSYWTYKICPGQYVQQMHLLPLTSPESGSYETNKEIDVQVLSLPPDSMYANIQFLQSASVELGTYESSRDDAYYSRVKSTWGAEDDDFYRSTTEYYFNGALCPCESSPHGVMARSSKLVYDEECCQREKRTADDFLVSEGFRVLEVTEPIMCQYVVRVCRFCPSDYHYNTNDQTPSVDPSDFLHLMQTYIHHMPEPDSYTSAIDPHIAAFPPMPPSQISFNKELLREMFIHAYDSYMFNAFPSSELHPLTCTPGTFHLVRIPALTLIDTLDTLILMKNYTEFARSVERIRYLDSKMRREYKQQKRKDRDGEKGGLFGINQNVSVFETTIRVLGGLLSGHQLALAFMGEAVAKEYVWDKEGEVLWGYDGVGSLPDSFSCIPSSSSDNAQQCWAYDGILLTLAHDIGKRLVHAFDTDTGIPYGTVNVRMLPCSSSCLCLSY